MSTSHQRARCQRWVDVARLELSERWPLCGSGYSIATKFYLLTFTYLGRGMFSKYATELPINEYLGSLQITANQRCSQNKRPKWVARLKYFNPLNTVSEIWKKITREFIYNHSGPLGHAGLCFSCAACSRYCAREKQLANGLAILSRCPSPFLVLPF